MNSAPYIFPHENSNISMFNLFICKSLEMEGE